MISIPEAEVPPGEDISLEHFIELAKEEEEFDKRFKAIAEQRKKTTEPKELERLKQEEEHLKTAWAIKEAERLKMIAKWAEK